MGPGVSLSLFLVALIYASVGQAGASGYLAVMGWGGIAPSALKVSALILNIAVGAIGTFQFWRAGRLSWQTVYPFALLGFPFSLLGGATHLPASIFMPTVGALLLVSSLLMARSLLALPSESLQTLNPPTFLPALLTGAGIGFVSGATGTGGGVFLAPVILIMGWGSARQTATITAVYNLMNSSAALLGAWRLWGDVPSAMPIWLGAVSTGGVVGAFVGSRYLPECWLRALLATLLFGSGIKFLCP